MNILPRASARIRRDVRQSGPGTEEGHHRHFKSVWIDQRRTRCVVGCGVILFHCAILAFLARVLPRWSLPREGVSTLVLLDLSEIPAVPITARPVTSQRSKISVVERSSTRLRQRDAAESLESGPLGQAPQPVASGSVIDWSAELGATAMAEAPALLADWRRKCHEAEMHGTLLAGCGQVKTPDIWKPHRGLAGLLAVGKRVPNGDIFDTMSEVDRDRSSLPDNAMPQEGPNRPPPLAFDPDGKTSRTKEYQ
jgi:hypothetical protein